MAPIVKGLFYGFGEPLELHFSSGLTLSKLKELIWLLIGFDKKRIEIAIKLENCSALIPYHQNKPIQELNCFKGEMEFKFIYIAPQEENVVPFSLDEKLITGKFHNGRLGYDTIVFDPSLTLIELEQFFSTLRNEYLELVIEDAHKLYSVSKKIPIKEFDFCPKIGIERISFYFIHRKSENKIVDETIKDLRNMLEKIKDNCTAENKITDETIQELKNTLENLKTNNAAENVEIDKTAQELNDEWIKVKESTKSLD